MKITYAVALAFLAPSAAIADDSPSDLPVTASAYAVPFQKPSINTPEAIRARIRNDQLSAIMMQQRATGEYRARPMLHLPLGAAYPPPVVRYIYVRPHLPHPGY